MTDKNQAIIDYLMTCPAIAESPLFFNFALADDSVRQLMTSSSDKIGDRTFIDGSVEKRFIFSITDFKSISPQPLAVGYSNENIEDILDVQGIIDWIEQQNDDMNYPDFGNYCEIDSIKVTTNEPSLDGIDTSVTPALAKYSISIQVDYIDTSKCLWNK